MIDHDKEKVYTVYTKYEWDEQKNKINIAKHRVSFEKKSPHSRDFSHELGDKKS